MSKILGKNIFGGAGLLIVHGSTGSPSVIDPLVGLIITASEQRQMWFVVSQGGPETVTAVPQVAVGSMVGQELIIMGTDDTDATTFSDGNGLKLNGPVTLGLGQSCYLAWDGTDWSEISRR
jgi:hypothetical protein